MSDNKNTIELQKFVHAKKLRNRHSIINFTALVVINTAKNQLIQNNSTVMISFEGYDNYGTVSILDNDIDPNLYPTVLNAKWQTFEFIGNEYLEIKGIHKYNVEIGTYLVKITPLQ